MSDIGIVVDLDDQTIEQGKVVLDYTSRDFVAIRTQLVGLAKGLMPEWQTAGETSDFGTLLLELFAYMGDVLHFYIDRTASEAFLGTAVRRQSLLYIADMMGYSPIGQQAASVRLNLTLDPDDPQNVGTILPITLPPRTKFYNSAGNSDEVIVFELSLTQTIQPGTTIVIYANEGLTVEAKSLGLCSGVPNTEFVIPDKGVIFGTVQVQTREGYQVVDWTTSPHLSTARPTQAVFTVFNDESGYTHIVFGDNSSGRIPPVNAEVFVTYRYGVGAVANDLAANSVDTIGPVADIDMFGLSVTNPASPVGGSDPETLDAMRYTISRGGTRIKDRAVTLVDYADLAMQVPGVTKSVAYGTVYTAVHVVVAPPNGQADDAYMARLCNSVTAYLDDKIMVGSSVYVHPAHVEDLWQDVFIRITVHVQDSYNRSTVRLQVASVVRSLLAFTAVDFGYRVSIGMIYRAILAVQGVEYAELQWLSTDAPPNELAVGDDSTTVTLLSGAWNYVASTVMAAPSDTNIRLNNATAPTALAVSTTAIGPTELQAQMQQLKIGDHIMMMATLDSTKWLSLIVTATPAITLQTTVEVQTVTPTGTISAGTFTLTLLGVTTAAIAWNATAAAIKTAIDTAIPGNTVTVGGGPVNTTAFTLTFTNYGDVAQVTIASALTGTTPLLTPTTTTAGGARTTNLGWASITVVKVSQSTVLPAAGTSVDINFLRYTPETPNDVHDIITPELLIPRISPPLPVLTYSVTNKVLTANVATLTLSMAHELIVGYTILVAGVDAVFNGTYVITAIAATTVSYAKTNANVTTAAVTPVGTLTLIDPAVPEKPTDFPGMSETERTHDGLWVKAVGGLPNT